MQKEADCSRWNLISIPLACNQQSEFEKKQDVASLIKMRIQKIFWTHCGVTSLGCNNKWLSSGPRTIDIWFTKLEQIEQMPLCCFQVQQGVIKLMIFSDQKWDHLLLFCYFLFLDWRIKHTVFSGGFTFFSRLKLSYLLVKFKEKCLGLWWSR